MAGTPWLFSVWFKATDVAEVFTSATRPYEIASDAKILEAMSSSGVLSRSVDNGKVTRITCLSSDRSFRYNWSFNHEEYAPENVKKLVVYRESALTYEIQRLYVRIVSWYMRYHKPSLTSTTII